MKEQREAEGESKRNYSRKRCEERCVGCRGKKDRWSTGETDEGMREGRTEKERGLK